jgi:opacity protein-like surface antigen
MKKLFAVFVAFLMLCSIVSAQDMPAGNQAGAKSLNFTFLGLAPFGLSGTGPGGGLGVSYFLSSEAAVRLGLQVGLNSATAPYNGAGAGTDGDFSEFALGIGADYLMYMGGGRVKPYMGAGVGISLASNSGKQPVASGGTANEITNGTPSDYAGTGVTITNTPGLSFGLVGIAGAEFYLYNEISLSAEYQLNLFSMASISDTEMKSGNTTVTRKNGSATSILGFGAAGATIHIYF